MSVLGTSVYLYNSTFFAPHRGMNGLHIEGRRFRSADNSGLNEPGPKNVHAPQKLRKFYFVLNDADYRRAFEALQVLLWPYTHSQQQIDEAENLHSKLRKGRGKLTIRDLTLNALELGKKAGIDRMIFDVEVMLPRKPASDLSRKGAKGAK